MKFEPMEKIPRWSRGCIITEKIDGTNASVIIVKEQPGLTEADYLPLELQIATAEIGEGENKMVGHIWAGSRTRLITPKTDNYGFAAWVEKNAHELIKLGPGFHFGEWWGSGIQRKYGLTNGERHFSLFDTRWTERENKPTCCDVVPVLYRGVLEDNSIRDVLTNLSLYGSVAAQGFMKPEGIIIWHSAARSFFKKTFEKDQEGKGE